MFHIRKFKKYRASPNISHPPSQGYTKTGAFSLQGVQMCLETSYVLFKFLDTKEHEE